MSRPLDNEGNPYDTPSAWFPPKQKPQPMIHFKDTTAAAYKRGDYKDIPNDELAILYRGVVDLVLNRLNPKEEESIAKLEDLDREIRRRIEAAGIELV